MVIWLRRSSHLEKVWLVATKRKDAATTTRESYGIKESKMKFERKFGWDDKDLITIEAESFEKITMIQDFIDFQEYHGWGTEYLAYEPLDDEDDEDEEVPPFALDTHEPL